MTQIRPGFWYAGVLVFCEQVAANTTTSRRTWPRLFLKDFEQTGTALWFFLYLLTWLNLRTGCFRGSFKRVSEKIGVSVVEIKRWLEQLEGEGYLKDESLDSKIVVKVLL